MNSQAGNGRVVIKSKSYIVMKTSNSFSEIFCLSSIGILVEQSHEKSINLEASQAKGAGGVINLIIH